MSLQTFKESGALMEHVVTLDGMSWEGFNKIASDFDEVSSLKLSYLGGLLEIMAPISDEPENVKSTVGALLSTEPQINRYFTAITNKHCFY